MRSALLVAAMAPAAVLADAVAAPPTQANIYDVKISGNGCPTGKTTSNTGKLGDSISFSYPPGFTGDNTSNCAIMLQANGASQGWQVAVKGVSVSGDVTLKSGSALDTITTVFWSHDAADTSTLRGHLPCTGPDVRDSFTISQSTTDLVWSKCTDATGYTGILNLNFRPVIQGNYGKYDIKSSKWDFVWRKC